jgi:hypothetical protein
MLHMIYYDADVRIKLRIYISDLTVSHDVLTAIGLMPHNLQTASKKKAGPMLTATREILTKFFDTYNRDLADILEDDRYMWA